jgi:hypothetical protein
MYAAWFVKVSPYHGFSLFVARNPTRTAVLRGEVAEPASGGIPANPAAAAYLLPLLAGLPSDKALISSIR